MFDNPFLEMRECKMQDPRTGIFMPFGGSEHDEEQCSTHQTQREETNS